MDAVQPLSQHLDRTPNAGVRYWGSFRQVRLVQSTRRFRRCGQRLVHDRLHDLAKRIKRAALQRKDVLRQSQSNCRDCGERGVGTRHLHVGSETSRRGWRRIWIAIEAAWLSQPPKRATKTAI